MLRYFEPAAKVVALPPDHEQVTRTPASKLIHEVKGSIGIRSIPCCLEPLASRSVLRSSQKEWVARKCMVGYLIPVLRYPGSAGRAFDQNTAIL
jgi:hypothetical protein